MAKLYIDQTIKEPDKKMTTFPVCKAPKFRTKTTNKLQFVKDPQKRPLTRSHNE